MGCCEHRNENLGSIIDGEFLDQLGDIFLKRFRFHIVSSEYDVL
jgi:hypothetical protein